MSVEQYSLVANDWLNLEAIINDLTQRVVGQEVHPTSSPTFADITITGDLDITGDVDIGGTVTLDGLTASRLVATDASKGLESVDLIAWVAGTTNEITVADDSDGTITIGIADPLIVGKGGTGRATSTTAYGLLAAGTTATGTHQTLAAGLVTQILVGGGAAAVPAWGTNIPTAVTIGSAYIYRVGGTDVAVTDGGTGTGSLTDHGILLGSGTSAITPLGVAANGQIPIGSAGADPVLAEIIGTANQITSIPGAGTITLSTPQDIHTGAGPTFANLVLSGTVNVALDTSGGTWANADLNLAAVPVLQANGTQFLKLDPANNNLIIGDGAFQNDEGANNIGLGTDAGYNNDTTGGGSEGEYNIYIGKNSGYGLTGATLNTGRENVGMGNASLQYNTSGYRNFGLGANALRSNTSGRENIAIGFNAAYSNATGYACVAIGSNALFDGVGGLQNVGIGQDAGSNNAGGHYNTFIGVEAGKGVHGNSQNKNVIIGRRAGYRVTGSSENVFIGVSSGDNSSSGDKNTYVGSSSGFVFTTASRNVMIGYKQGLTTGGIIAAATESDLFAIGNEGPATNLPLIEGYFAAHASGPKLFINGDLTYHNATHEDADGGRETKLVYRGEQSGGEETSLFQFEASHDGGSDDQLGKGVWSVNTGAGLVAVMKIDSNAATLIGDAGVTNYSKFEADGTLEFNGTATVWNDIQFPLSGAKVPASNAPTWETFTVNTKEYSFGVNDYIDTQANEVFHSWKLGTTGHVHTHITTKAANSTGSDRFAKFQIWISYCDTGETWQETNFTAELTIPDGTAALELFYLDMGDLMLTNFITEVELKLRVKRIAATGGTEYSGNIFITEAGVHIESNTVGSRQESTK